MNVYSITRNAPTEVRALSVIGFSGPYRAVLILTLLKARLQHPVTLNACMRHYMVALTIPRIKYLVAVKGLFGTYCNQNARLLEQRNSITLMPRTRLKGNVKRTVYKHYFNIVINLYAMGSLCLN